MRIKKTIALCAGLLAVFGFISCGDLPGDYNTFDYKLRGTWETNQYTSQYAGTLVIDLDTIKITGYAPNTIYERHNGTENRPFPDITQNTFLSGYSEDGKIFIEDAGIVESYAYNYYTGDNGETEFLRFQFGNRTETLRKVQ